MEVGAAGRFSFSTLQGAVGLIAGLTSILGATYSAVGFLKTGTPTGEIVAVVRDAATEQPVRGAVVEILTPENGLVAAVPQRDGGPVRRAIPPGSYRVRVVHPDYTEVRRDVRVMPEAAAEMHVMLERRGRSRKPAPEATADARPGGGERAAPPSPGQVVDRSVSVTRKILGRIRF